MYLNDKLRDNIINRIVDDVTGDMDSASLIDNAISQAEDDTWRSMSLSERCGPSLWWFLHWIAAVSDDENNPYLYYRALSLLQEGHPCREVCRPHMKENLQILDPRDFSSAVEHSISLHNLVNRQLHKEQFPMKDAINRLDLGCDTCTFAPDGKGNSSNNNESKNRYSNISINDRSKKIYQEDNYVQYPSNYRVRDTSAPRVYTSNGSPSY